VVLHLKLSTHTTNIFQQAFRRLFFRHFDETSFVQVLPVAPKQLHEQIPALPFVEWFNGVAFAATILDKIVIFSGSNQYRPICA
jgi:hypothetical protein